MTPVDKAPKRNQVLLVDDSPTVRMDLRAALHEAGFQVTACPSKAAAEKAIRTRSFDLYILDVLLGDGSGIDLLREIRSRPELATAKVLMLSAEAEIRHRVRGLRVGADDYMGKPYNRHVLMRRARELVKISRGDAPPSSGLQGGGKKILVVDDSPTYGARLVDALREDGHELVLAASGEEALELLSVDRVDAIVIDLHMPGLGGVETCRRVRADRARWSVPVLVLVGVADYDAMRADCLAAGADDVATKSPELSMIKVRLRGLLRAGRKASDGGELSGPSSSRRRSTPMPMAALAAIPLPVPTPSSLLDRVILASGIAPGLSAGAVARACARAGVNATTMSPSDLRRALPALRQMLRLFVSPEDVNGRMAAIELLASSAGGV